MKKTGRETKTVLFPGYRITASGGRQANISFPSGFESWVREQPDKRQDDWWGAHDMHADKLLGNVQSGTQR